MTIGERIKKLRNNLGLSQVNFADKINVSKQTLYKYENNIITNIPSDKIESVAKLCNVSPAYLMGWEEELQKPSATITLYNVHCETQPEAELVLTYRDLNDVNKKKVSSYTRTLLSTQQMEDEVYEVAAAHDMNASSEQKKHADDIMKDPSEWE